MLKNQKLSVKVPHHAMNAPGTEQPRGVSGRKRGNAEASRLFGPGRTRTKPWQVRGNAKAVFFLFFIPLLLFAGPALSYDGCDFEIAVQISPNIINLQSRSRVLTVHTDIAYDEVFPQSVYLIVSGDQGDQNVTITSWKADDLGYFVAKFSMVDIEDMELEIGAFNTFTMVGNTPDGEVFCGEQDIMIDEVVSEGNKAQEQKMERTKPQQGVGS